jgi:hypothetical protein
MKKTVILPEWAPRIKPFLIRRLYESDAQGRLDEGLLDEVGWALYSRCDSFLMADEARKGLVHCPVCRSEVHHTRRTKELMHCSTCGWECTVGDYLDTARNQQLDGGPEVIALFQEYTRAFPHAVEPSRKMLLVDGLIHGFHHFLRSGRTRRPVGINLIVGHIEFVVDFLDNLSAGPGSTPGVQETIAGGEEKIHQGSTQKHKKEGS